ncbi:MAG: hypothetical protein HZA06_02165 [Nitrospirae bacterium]|nr:hypothetical protein [Nitrospirota bacterium]
MSDILLPVFHTLLVLILTIALGEVFFKILPIDNDRIKGVLVVPLGMVIWAAFPFIFSILLNVSPFTLKTVIWSSSVIALFFTRKEVFKRLSDYRSYIVFIAFISLFFHKFQIPGNGSLLLGDAPEYMQIARNIVNGLGYSVNFLIADHFNNGMDSIIRPVHNRFPLILFQLSAIGTFIGFKNYLINIIIVILAGNCLNYIANLASDRFKRLVVWSIPLLFSAQGLFMWAGALEYQIMAYIFAFSIIIYELKGRIDIRHLVFIAIIEIGILYGGNGAGIFIFSTAIFSAAMIMLYQKILAKEPRILRLRHIIVYFIILPSLLFSPWVIRSVKANVAGNGLYNFMSYNGRTDGIEYCTKSIKFVVDDIGSEIECKECLNRSFIRNDNPYCVNFLMSYYFFKDHASMQSFFDNSSAKEFLASLISDINFLKHYAANSIFKPAFTDYYSHLWQGDIPFLLQMNMLIIALFFFKARDVIFFAILFNLSMLFYAGNIQFMSTSLPRKFIPFLPAQWLLIAVLVERALIAFQMKTKAVAITILTIAMVFMFGSAVVNTSEDYPDVLAISKWITENTKKEDVIYADPPQLFTFMTGRRAVGSSWSEVFFEMADRKYKPDYFIINNYRGNRGGGAYRRAADYLYNGNRRYEVLFNDTDRRYIIFRRSPRETLAHKGG